MRNPRFFDPLSEIRHTENCLPHWQQPGATYFVTFRLSDSIPSSLREQLEEERDIWVAKHPHPWNAETEQEFHRRFSGAVERWLDSGHGSCILREPMAANVVADALDHFDGQRYVNHAWVVMPSHVHTLFSLHSDWSLERTLHSWKSFTGHELAKRTSLRPVWQEDYFDRLIRNEDHFANCIRYIRRNPEKAGLSAGAFRHFESESAKRIE